MWVKELHEVIVVDDLFSNIYLEACVECLGPMC
jgi:hypothetical protein